MRYPAALSLLLCLGASFDCFAADAPSEPAEPAQSSAASNAPPAAPAAVATAATTPAASAKTSAADAALVAQVHRLRSAGYKPKVKDGATIWCKQQTSLGSRLTQVEICGSADQVEQSIQDSKDAVETAQRRVTERQSN
jgi:hypothetical protein